MSHLIKNCSYLDEEYNIVSGRDILIENGMIIKIGRGLDPTTASVIDSRSHLLVPGLINAHYHLGETIFRGSAPNSSLEDYLSHTSRVGRELRGDESHKVISQLSLYEALVNGTTLVSCARGWEAAREMEIRGVLSYPLMRSDKLIDHYHRFEKEFKGLCERYTRNFCSSSPQTKMGLWLHSINYTDEEMLESASRNYAEDDELTLTIHVAETAKQREEVLTRYGLSEIEILDRFDLLDSRTNLVHCNHVSENDLHLIKEKSANITVCPASNTYLNTGLPDLERMLDLGINISIGTDGLATGVSASLIETAKITYLLFRDLDLPATELWDMITKNPARTLGFERCGSIREGNYADINFFNMMSPSIHPIEDAARNLLFASYMTPERVMVDGRFVVEGGMVLDGDEMVRAFR
ncbi:amidohydrolase family protein, partial [Thermoproteota archaeon]